MGGGGVRSCSMEQHFRFVAASDCASYVVATRLPQRKLGEQRFRHQDSNPGRSGEGRVS